MYARFTPAIPIWGDYQTYRYSSYAGTATTIGAGVGVGVANVIGRAVSARVSPALPEALKVGNNARTGVSVYAGISNTGDDI